MGTDRWTIKDLAGNNIELVEASLADYWRDRCDSAEAALEQVGGEPAHQHFEKWRTLATSGPTIAYR